MSLESAGIELGEFQHYMTSGSNKFNDFPDNQLTKFCVFIGLSWIFIPY